MGWVRIYQESFPASQRMKVGKIRSQISDGHVRLHETRIGRRTVCFSIVECVSERTLLLSYMAADPTFRSHGLGTLHMQRLLRLLAAEFPQANALYFEIENRREGGLTVEQEEQRRRRGAFYERLAARGLPGHHLSPNLVEGGCPVEFELMWLELGETRVDRRTARKALRELLTVSYQLPAGHPLVVQA